MFGQPPPFRPCVGGGGGPGVAQPLGLQQIHPNPNIFPNPNFFYFLPQQNPNFLPPPNPFLQNPITFPPIQQQIPFNNLSFQTKPEKKTNQAPPPPPPPPPTSERKKIDVPKQHVSVQRKSVQEVDKAAMEAWRELLESNENVSAFKVSTATLLKVKADSWKSLGYELHQVPSLSRLLAVEQKIHAFIQCFVAVRRITSLYDLEVAICESEGVERFEDLELGPLLRHPLVVQCFSVNSDLKEIYRITTEEIISCLCEFIDSHKQKEFKADVFLDFVSKKKSVNGREKLCVRVVQGGEYINNIKQARQSEDIVLDKCYEKMRTSTFETSDKCPPFSAEKQELDEYFTSVSEQVKSFSSKNTQFCGKHTRFASSSSEEDKEEKKYKKKHKEKKTKNNCSVSTETSDRVTSCPYPSVTEEMTRLGLKSELDPGSCTPAGGTKSIADNELSQRKRRSKNKSSSTTLPKKLRKRDKFVEDLENKGSDQATGSHSISTTTSKESCLMNDVEEIETREPFFCGSADNSFVISLVNWVLPYAQRYIYKKHPENYFQLKQSDFENIRHLKIVVVEKLFYRNVTKNHGVTSRERHECNCLLQDNILYCSLESDARAVISELSCFLLSQDHNLYFAKFLHMITAMVESGVTEEQTEFFVLNSQKVPKLPADECIWSLQPVSSSNNDTPLKTRLSVNPDEPSSSVIKRKPGINSSWPPPVEWETEPEFEDVEQFDIPPTELGSEMNIEVDPTSITQEAVLFEPEISESSCNLAAAAPIDSADLDLPDMNTFVVSNRTGQLSAQQQQAMLTGRLGELVAFRYFVGKLGGMFVKWVNETNETGLPYDIVLGGEDENSREYVEVKATKHERKNWFQISMREWQFAIEKGESFSIAHVLLTDNNNMAKVTVYKNPTRLCQLGNLRLAVVVPNVVE